MRFGVERAGKADVAIENAAGPEGVWGDPREPSPGDTCPPAPDLPCDAEHTVANRSIWLDLPILAAVVVLAGLTPVAAKDALREMPPLTTGVMRFGIAGLLLMATYSISRLTANGAARPIARAHWPRIWLAAALCVPINQFCFLLGLERSGSAQAGLMYALNPVLVFLLTLMLGRTRGTRRMAAASVLAFCGAAVIGWDNYTLTGGTRGLTGTLLLFCAVLTWAAYCTVSVPLIAEYGALRTAATVMPLGVLMYLPVVFIDGANLRPGEMSWRGVGGFAFITLGASYLNYLLWFVGLERIDVNRMSVTVNASPLVAVIGSYFWHAERISRWLLLGATVILAAILLANWDRVRVLIAPQRKVPTMAR
jgi:drug/metabolite transporter (DMT)-like permease